MRVGNVGRFQALMGRHGEDDHKDALPCGPDGQIPQLDLWAWKQLHPTAQDGY